MTIERTSTTKIREIVTSLNRADFSAIDYEHLLTQVGVLIKGTPMKVQSLPVGTTLYRGVIYSERPSEVSYLGSPPAALVTNFQRCNGPGKPMFYASVDIAAVFSELNAEVGDIVYLSSWIVDREFFCFRIPPGAGEGMEEDFAFSKIETFFETRFAQPIHETFSAQYKLTAAITEKLSTGNVLGLPELIKGRPFGAVIYPSVAHTSRSDNIAIQTSVAQSCLRLSDVRAIEVTERQADSHTVREIDFSSDFEDEHIKWLGRPRQWTLNSMGTFNFTVENGMWVARTEDGTVINPS
ncbi:RES domain-containing protein [Pseudomonas gingeri]|uniref:RES domain-containing protein n=1 Tax=Pseudomonas gingeri TaxID=117681 RepID=A0A7Y7Y1V0_9PSED|nr:RES domain-containing protein [Pseudomonas gingeri]NWC16174.1 RES domain-containing protein [Pseudomonas gingeri]